MFIPRSEGFGLKLTFSVVLFVNFMYFFYNIRMKTFIKAKLKKSDGQTNIDIAENHIKENLLLL